MSEIFDVIPSHPDVERFVDISYDFSGQIIRLLKKRGMTQHDLAVKLGKKDSEVSRWLQGNHNFTFKTAAAVEVALGAKILKVTEVVPYEEPEPTYREVPTGDRRETQIVEQGSWALLGSGVTQQIGKLSHLSI